MMKMWSKIFWEKRGFWEPFQIFLLLVARPVSRVWRTLVSILNVFFVRENVRSLVIRNNRFVALKNTRRVFLQRDERARVSAWENETIEEKERRKRWRRPHWYGGESRSVNGGVRAAFWRASKCSVLHPMDFAPYHRVSSGNSALCYHYC